MKKGLPSLAPALAAGACLALALPGLNWWPLVFLFPGLLLESIRGRSWKFAAGMGAAAGILHWMIAAHWVVPLLSGYGALSRIGSIGGLLGMSLILASTWVPAVAATALFDARLRPLMFPVTWILAEALRAFPPIAFPWNTTASCLASSPGLLGCVSIWTSAGLGWALIAVGSGMWSLLRRESRSCALLLLIPAVSLWVLFSLPGRPAPTGKPVRVSLIQPGTLVDERWDPSNWEELTRRVQTLSEAAAADRPEILLWPESAVPWSFASNPAFHAEILRLAARMKTTIVLNSLSRGEDGTLYNSAYSVQPEGRVARYDKIHLVPFGEYIPKWAKLFFPRKLVHELGSFEAGKEVRLLDVPFPAGMSICFEMVFPRLAAAECRKGAELLLTLTNDGWYGRSWAPDQHFAQAVLRAVECRRWVIRAALTGVSGIISPEGRVISRLDTGQRGVLSGTVFQSSALSFAARFPDWWNWVCVLMLLAGCCFGLRSRSPAA